MSNVKNLDDYLDSFHQVLLRMEAEQVDGVHGVVHVDTGKPGPVVGITACTHGNEPSGLAAMEHLLETLEIRNSLLCGQVYLCVNNLEAAKAFFEDRSKLKSERKHRRQVDMNMNRLPKSLLEENGVEYEVVRAKDLHAIWRRFTHGLDIHSTTADSSPMIITGNGRFETELVRGFPISIVIDKIDYVQIGSPAYGFFGDREKRIPVLEIEAGTHEKVESFERARICVEALLKNLKMLPGSTEEVISAYDVYEIFDTVIFPNDSFELSRPFKDFERVSEGTTLARSRGTALVATTDCVPIFPPLGTRPRASDKEEVMFLSYPVRRITAAN